MMVSVDKIPFMYPYVDDHLAHETEVVLDDDGESVWQVQKCLTEDGGPTWECEDIERESHMLRLYALMGNAMVKHYAACQELVDFGGGDLVVKEKVFRSDWHTN